MKKIFSFLCMFMAMTAMISCSSSKEEKGTTGTGNVALDNIFERKSVRTYLNKGDVYKRQYKHPAEEHTNRYRVSNLKYQRFL